MNMNTFETSATVEDQGQIHLAGVPFAPGTEVEATLERWAELLSMRTVNVGSPPEVPDFPRDPKDALFLAAALAVHADFLITGDRDLLAAKDVVATRIITTADFSSEFGIS